MNKSRFIWVLCITLVTLICFGAGCSNAINPEVTGEGQTEVVSPAEIPDSGNQGGGTTPSEPEEPFIPDIMDTDEKVEIGGDYDFSTVYDYSGAELTLVNGNFTVDRDANGFTYQATTANSLSVNMGSLGVPFPYGTMSADVVNLASDTGIVFGLTSNKTYFWEGSGISYYFYFVNLDGNAYLGKADNGGWAALCTSKIEGWNANTSYNLKVIFKGNKILCFVNNEYVFGYHDTSALKGTGWGVRAGKAGATIKNLQISSTLSY